MVLLIQILCLLFLSTASFQPRLYLFIFPYKIPLIIDLFKFFLLTFSFGRSWRVVYVHEKETGVGSRKVIYLMTLKLPQLAW